MHVGILRVEIFIPESNSLKTKRRILRTLKDRIRNKFNVSVGEVDALDKWQRSVIGLACISRDKKHIDAVLNKTAELIDTYHSIELISREMEIK